MDIDIVLGFERGVGGSLSVYCGSRGAWLFVDGVKNDERDMVIPADDSLELKV